MADQKITELTAVVTPDNADTLPTVNGGATKKITWTIIKAFLKTYFDTVYRLIDYNNYAADAGSTDAYAITITTPTIAAYVIGQEFTFKANTANTGACTLNVNGIAAISIKKNVTEDLDTGDILANQIVVVKYDGTNMQMLSHISFNVTKVKFGGTGADGALAITSGTTTIDCANAKVKILNYSSISITGTGKLAFSNPHSGGTIIVIKCKGDCTLTSSTVPMIDASGMGAGGGSGAVRSSSGGNTNGGDGTDGNTYSQITTKKGVGGNPGTGGAVGSLSTLPLGVLAALSSQFLSKYPQMFVGAGGSGGNALYSTGSGSTITSGAGGNGGGCLIMEIGGAINFTVASGISVAGRVGSNGVVTGSGGGGKCAGGGGGGGGGSAFIFYNTLTAFSGTVDVSGGVGGTNGNSDVFSSSSGGGGGGSAITAGSNGSSVSVTATICGGTGAAGLETHGLNTEFA